MVMLNIYNPKSVFKLVAFTLCVGTCGVSSALEFYTIIGPDGRPMVVQQKRLEKKVEKVAKKTESNEKKAENRAIPDSKAQNSKIQSSEIPSRETQTGHNLKNTRSQKDSTVMQPQTGFKKTNSEIIQTSAPLHTATLNNHSIQPIPVKVSEKELHLSPNTGHKAPILTPHNSSIESKNKATKKIQNQTAHQPAHIEKQLTSTVDHSTSIQQKQGNSSKVQAPKTSESTTANSNKFTEIDGVQYVDNEFLEDKEFNLEGRKRFYVMPEGGIVGGRFETVERQKGITKSLLSKFSKKGIEDKQAVVLAASYHRLAKDDLVQTLEQSCFSGKKLDNAKTLGPNNTEIGFWPVAPFKEKFVYEVVKFDSSVENIHFSSYASSQKKPSYYWPLVVFLDQKGCVVEGVSGFKNQDINQNKFQHSALEGVLKIPDNAVYMLMTPLAEAVDVPELILSNQGQVKLSVLL